MAVTPSWEYLVRWSDGGREILVELITPFSVAVIWVANGDVFLGDDVEACEALILEAMAAASADAGMTTLRFYDTPDDELVVIARTGDVFAQLVG